MVRTKDGDGIKSNLIVTEVQKRPCLFDSNYPTYGDRAEKARSWEEVCESVVPGWTALTLPDKIAAGHTKDKTWQDSTITTAKQAHAEGLSTGLKNPSGKGKRLIIGHIGKEVQKRWRSIRDSFTKAYRQGKCVMPDQCPMGSRRYNYHKQMSFLLRALQNKKPRCSQDKYESYSEVSSSPQHLPDDLTPRIKHEIDKPLDLKTTIEKPTQDKCNQASIEEMKNPALEIKIDANSILPDDHFDDDKLFMNSLLPLFKKMDDDTRLLCRIEVLKIIRYALQGHKCFEALRLAEDSFFKNRITGILTKEEAVCSPGGKTESRLSMTTRSADGSRPVRTRRLRSPSPLPVAPKRRGPGRPRKVRPPPSDSDEEPSRKRPRAPKLKVAPIPLREPPAELEDGFSTATSVTQLSTPMFMKMYNLGRSKDAPLLPSTQNMQISIKTEPIDNNNTS